MTYSLNMGVRAVRLPDWTITRVGPQAAGVTHEARTLAGLFPGAWLVVQPFAALPAGVTLGGAWIDPQTGAQVVAIRGPAIGISASLVLTLKTLAIRPTG